MILIKRTALVMVFIVLFAAVDLILYTIIAPAFAKYARDEMGGGVYRILESKAEVLVLGTSRAKHHIDPLILEKGLGLSAFNGGWNGMGLPFVRGLTDLILRSYVPKIIILHIDPEELVYTKTQIDKTAYLAPFIDQSDVVKSLIYQRSFFEPLKYESRTFRYNTRALTILKALLIKDFDSKGFIPLGKTFHPEQYKDYLNSLSMEPPRPDERFLQMLKAIISQARLSGSIILIVTSPTWRPIFSEKYLMSLEDVASTEHVAFLAVHSANTPAFRDPSYYADANHLNRQGATLFSEILMKWIKNHCFVNKNV